MTDGVLSAFGLHNPAGPDEEPPLWAFTPQLRISGLLAWQARGVGEMTPESVRALTGQTVIFDWRGFRAVYRLKQWHPVDAWARQGDCGYFDAEWPD
jgi:hypothetical protein